MSVPAKDEGSFVRTVSEETPASPVSESRRRVLITGANGFLGAALSEELAASFSVTRLDVVEKHGPGAFLGGSVCDAALAAEACRGANLMVLGHMAPRLPGAYSKPDEAYDINIKGTAIMLHAAMEAGIKRVVIISSVTVVHAHQMAGTFLRHDLPPAPRGQYALTKLQQEIIGRYYHENHGMEVACLRPAYIYRADSNQDKYGKTRPSVNWQFIDPRDIGAAAACALRLPELGFEIFHLMAGPGAEQKADVERSFDRLGWTPRYRFEDWPEDDK